MGTSKRLIGSGIFLRKKNKTLLEFFYDLKVVSIFPRWWTGQDRTSKILELTNFPSHISNLDIIFFTRV